LLLVISTGAIAAVAVTFARYAVVLFGIAEGTVTPIAVAAILLLSAVNYLGVRPGANTQNVFTVLKLVALTALIVVGLAVAPEAVELSAPAEPASTTTSLWVVFAAVGVALIPVLFSYGGWQQTNYVAEEIVQPERTLPRALVLGVTGVVVVYVLANLVYVRQLGVVGLADSLAPAADVMDRTMGSGGRTFISAGIAASTFGFLNLVILVTPRVYQAMARDGLFLSRVARLHPGFGHLPRLSVFRLHGLWCSR
jgi:APA family basic amino acid/polyamine antiporter